MNKGLEVIEAHWLFDLPFEQIEVVVHPQSVIHSMVEFVDDSIKMQASLPSMHLPIQDALSYPDRLDRSGYGAGASAALAGGGAAGLRAGGYGALPLPAAGV